MSSVNTLALIPARAGSKGIPGKNLRTLGGKTLIQLAVECARGVPVDTAWVTTDMQHLCADDAGANMLWRPAELASDTASMLAVVQHALAQIPGPEDQIIVLLQPTQPFRTPEHVQQAIALLRETQADSVVSVVELPRTHHPAMQFVIEGGVELFAYGWPEIDWDRLPASRQSCRETYNRDGTVYAFWRKTVNQHGNIYGQDVRPLIIPADESCELDTEQDWAEVERRWRIKMSGEAI